MLNGRALLLSRLKPETCASTSDRIAVADEGRIVKLEITDRQAELLLRFVETEHEDAESSGEYDEQTWPVYERELQALARLLGGEI